MSLLGYWPLKYIFGLNEQVFLDEAIHTYVAFIQPYPMVFCVENVCYQKYSSCVLNLFILDLLVVSHVQKINGMTDPQSS